MTKRAITQYRIVSAELALDGSTVTVGFQLLSAKSIGLGEHNIIVNLPAEIGQTISEAVLEDLETFESNTGWTRFVPEVPE